MIDYKKILVILTFSSLSACATRPISNEKIVQIHEEILTVDSHIDWPIRQYRTPDFDPGIRHEYNDYGSGQWDIIRMKEGGLDAVFMAIFTPQKERTNAGHLQAKQQALKMIELTQKMAQKNSEVVEVALLPEDAYRLEKIGKRAIFLGMENGYPLGEDLKNLKLFYDLGVRYITLTHTKNNEIADSSTDEKQEWEGLSSFGERVVAEMNRLGMMIDISHVHDDTFWDVIRLSKAPIIASHSGVKAIYNVPRNLSDEMLKAIKKNGGVVQVYLYGDGLKKIEQTAERQKALKELEPERNAWLQGKLNPDEAIAFKNKEQEINQKYPQKLPTLADAIAHIDYIVKLVGIDYVGIGSDFDGGGGLIGIDDVSQMHYITQELVKRGYSREDIRKLWGGNLMRVFQEVNRVGQELNNR